MDLETYHARSSALHQELGRIADEMYQQAVAGTANPANPRFTALWQRQTAIHSELARLDASVGA